MFDRKVHHLDKRGRLKAVTPYIECTALGYPNLIVYNGRLTTEDGSPYPVDMMLPIWKQRYAKLIKEENRLASHTPKEHVEVKDSALLSSPSFVDQLAKDVLEEDVDLGEFEGKIIKKRGRPKKVVDPTMEA